MIWLIRFRPLLTLAAFVLCISPGSALAAGGGGGGGGGGAGMGAGSGGGYQRPARTPEMLAEKKYNRGLKKRESALKREAKGQFGEETRQGAQKGGKGLDRGGKVLPGGDQEVAQVPPGPHQPRIRPAQTRSVRQIRHLLRPRPQNQTRLFRSARVSSRSLPRPRPTRGRESQLHAAHVDRSREGWHVDVGDESLARDARNDRHRRDIDQSRKCRLVSRLG